MTRIHGAVLALAAALAAVIACGPDGPTAPDVEPSFDVTAPFSGSVRAGARQSLNLWTQANEPLLFFAEGRGGNPGDSLVVVVGTPDGSGELGRLAFSPVAGATAASAIYLTAFPVETQLPVTVRGLRASDAGSYRLRVEAPTVLPEHADEVLQLDTEVMELHDGHSDIDRFRVSVTAGSRYLLLLGKRSFIEPRGLSVVVRDANGALGGRTETRADHAPELGQVPFEPRITGEAHIIVTGPAGHESWYDGSYTLRVIESSRAPETAPSSIALNDTIAESIDVVGDIDEYTFSATAGTRLRIWPRLDRDVAALIYFTVFRGATQVGRVSASDSTDWENAWPGDFVLPATDTYRLVVTGPLDLLPEQATTPYAFVLSQYANVPELEAAALAPGALVTGETLSGCADVDEFVIRSDTLVTVAVGVAGTSPGGCALRAVLLRGGSSLGEVSLTEATGDPDRHRLTSRTVDAGSPLRVRISALRNVTPSAPETPYVLDVYEVNAAPEDNPVLFTPGGTFTETMDRCGDPDEFEFDVPAATRLLLNVGLDRAVSCASSVSIVRSSPSYFVQRTVNPLSGGDTDADTWAVSLPLAGRYRLRWSSNVRGSSSDRGVGLSVSTEMLSLLPELAPATTFLDDTIAGETIARCGDVDEYRFTASPGEEVAVALSLERDVSCAVTAEIAYDFVAGWNVTTSSATPLDDTRSVYALLGASSSGEYVLRVRSEASGSTADRGTPYRVGVFRREARPETFSDTLVIGDSINTEGIEVPGDLDDFYVYFEVGQYAINVAGDVRMSIPSRGISINPASPLLPMGIRSTGVFAMNNAGYYRIRFEGADASTTGAYRFELVRIASAPEDAPAELPFGTWVTESLSPFNDRDEFFFRPDSTDWLAARVERVGSVGDLFPTTLFAGFAADGRSAPFKGFSDSIFVRASGFIYDPVTFAAGQYRVRIDRLDTDPEQVAPTFAVGDTIRGESLGFASDVDRFTTTISETGRHRIAARATSGCLVEMTSFVVLLEAPGIPLYQGISSGTWTATEFDATSADEVQLTTFSNHPDCQSGSYEFVLTRVP